jgi:hypothetical protein
LGGKNMIDHELVVVGGFTNDTNHEMRLFLELLGEEIVMEPGHSVELMASNTSGLLPLTVSYVEGGLQIHPHKEFDPNWHVRFNGRTLKAGHPTVLSEHA